MKSSSRFFPARLISAEVQDGLTEDVYLIKPNNSPDKKVELAVTHLSMMEGVASPALSGRPAIILLHGCYQNRRVWFTPGRDGLAKRLLLAGCDVWLVEQRGHGLSPVNPRFEANTLSDYARYDIPAVNMFVSEQAGSCPHWLACNEGAAALLLSLTSGALAQDTVASVVGLGQPLPQASLARVPGAHWLPSVLAGPASHRLPLGPEREPAGLCREAWRERSVFSHLGAHMGLNVTEQLSSLDLPVAWLLPQQQADLSGLGSLIGAGLNITRLQTPVLDERLLGDTLSDSLLDSTVLNELESPLFDFLGGELHGVLSAGEASSAA